MGARVQGCKISYVQSNGRLTFFNRVLTQFRFRWDQIQLRLCGMVHFKLDSTLTHAWCIKKLDDSSLPFVVPLTIGLELDSFNSTTSPQH